MIRKELYTAITERIKQVPGIAYSDLWNHNVEFIEQEEGWQRPALFVEFLPIQWQKQMEASVYTARVDIRLHLVTDWQGSASEGSPFREDNLQAFVLSQHLHEALAGMMGSNFQNLDLVESHTNHNHEDIIEHIDVYRCTAFRRL